MQALNGMEHILQREFPFANGTISFSNAGLFKIDADITKTEIFDNNTVLLSYQAPGETRWQTVPLHPRVLQFVRSFGMYTASRHQRTRRTLSGQVFIECVPGAFAVFGIPLVPQRRRRTGQPRPSNASGGQLRLPTRYLEPLAPFSSVGPLGTAEEMLRRVPGPPLFPPPLALPQEDAKHNEDPSYDEDDEEDTEEEDEEPSTLEECELSELISENCPSASLGPAHTEPCVICREFYKDGEYVRWLPCFHAFHSQCIMRWLQTGAPTCPICKTDVRDEFAEAWGRRRSVNA